MPKLSDLTSADLRQLIDYNAPTGLLLWKARPREMFHSDGSMKAWNARHTGKECFTTRDANGHRFGAIYGMRASAHRVAWCIFHGCWPDGLVDHINGDPADNRAENLRLATTAENSRNGKSRSNNTSGFTGVEKRGERSWRAVACFNGDRFRVGHFGCAVRAALERDKAMRKFDCPFVLFNFPLAGESKYRTHSPL